MSRFYVIYDPCNLVQVSHGDVCKSMQIKVVVIDLPDNDITAMEKAVHDLGIQLLAQFHQPDV